MANEHRMVVLQGNAPQGLADGHDALRIRLWIDRVSGLIVGVESEPKLKGVRGVLEAALIGRLVSDPEEELLASLRQMYLGQEAGALQAALSDVLRRCHY